MILTITVDANTNAVDALKETLLRQVWYSSLMIAIEAAIDAHTITDTLGQYNRYAVVDIKVAE